MDCTFKWTGIGGYACLKEERKVTNFQYRHYCDNPRYYKCPFYNNEEGKDKGKNKSVDDFFTIIIYGILGKFNDGKELIVKFNKFRREVLEKDTNCYALLVYQDRLSSLICDKIGNIINDSIKDSSKLIDLSMFIKNVIYNKYMLSIDKAIDNKKNLVAKKLYEEMLEELIKKLELIDNYELVKEQYTRPTKYRPNIKNKRPIGPKKVVNLKGGK